MPEEQFDYHDDEKSLASGHTLDTAGTLGSDGSSYIGAGGDAYALYGNAGTQASAMMELNDVAEDTNRETIATAHAAHTPHFEPEEEKAELPPPGPPPVPPPVAVPPPADDAAVAHIEADAEKEEAKEATHKSADATDDAANASAVLNGTKETGTAATPVKDDNEVRPPAHPRTHAPTHPPCFHRPPSPRVICPSSTICLAAAISSTQTATGARR